MEQNDKSRQKKTNPSSTNVSGQKASGGQKKAGINLQEYEYMERGEKEEEKHPQKESGFKINIINFHNEFNI